VLFDSNWIDLIAGLTANGQAAKQSGNVGGVLCFRKNGVDGSVAAQ
jgi:hypothetical protein